MFLDTSPKMPSTDSSTDSSDLSVSRERGTVTSDPSTTIIIIVLAIVILILLLLFVFCAYKFHRRRQYAEKSLEFNTGEIDAVKPVVKLLGYESSDKQWNNSPPILRDGELLTPLHKHSSPNIDSQIFLKGEKSVNLLSPNFDRNNCVRVEENIYLWIIFFCFVLDKKCWYAWCIPFYLARSWCPSNMCFIPWRNDTTDGF